MNRFKVLLVDDHELVRNGIASLLNSVDNLEVVALASNGHEAISVLETEEVDILLSDINMPKMDGINLAKMVHENYPKVKMLALSAHFEEVYIVKMLKAGVMGYLLKNTSEGELTEALETVMSGESYISPEVSKIMMSKYMEKQNLRSNLPSNFDPGLSDREIEVLKLIAEEFTNKEIAEKLFISPRTVDSHRRKLLEKLACKNTAGLVKYAVMKGYAA